MGHHRRPGQVNIMQVEDVNLRDDLELLRHQLKIAKKKIYEYERGEKREEIDRNRSLTEYLAQMRDLENENDRLKRMLQNADVGPMMLRSKGNEILHQQQAKKLEEENLMLKQELQSKIHIIEQFNKGGHGADMVAMENLRQANEKLMAQLIRLQQQISDPNMSATMNATGLFGNGMGNSVNRPRGVNPNSVKSEFI